MNGTSYDYGEVKELTRLCPYLPFLAKAVNAKPELVEALEKAEAELKENENPAAKTC